MASHFVALNRGIEGEKYSDFITGIAATGNLIELRIDDAGGFRAKDIELLILAFKRFFENPQQWSTAGFVIQP